ncbi:GNAT family N-acetyltransferase [Erythrobacter sp. SDW2]|uniref:GNAT family N-acetyltransferase n=1 Tax=Erythrobacter sp. SDW2 TaxID=2907154 RepID=UPI001F461640|nr:GNAT family N-acetyltransferase [Erythrobacter sp. SDW2]UIP06714.1 GNAT family N-acetyltransferase [Erythrobacter sp. SDW2]
MERQPVLEGERLLLRPLGEEDWNGLFAVASDPQVWAVHPANDRWQEPVFRAFFADALAQGGALTVIEKSSGTIVGSSRFQGYDPADGGSVEIGWTFLARRLWGGGYNAEMKRLMLEHALQSVERVDFRVGETNVISRRAMANIGGVLTDREDITVMAGVAHRHVIYEITRDSFAAGPLAQD